MRIRRVVLNSALLSCFLVYAISPLSRASEPPMAADRAAGHRQATFRNISIYFFEELLKALVSPGQGAMPLPGDAIFVMKTHAVVRLCPRVGQKLGKSAAAVASADAFTRVWTRVPAVDDAGFFQSIEIPAYSGLSPPPRCA